MHRHSTRRRHLLTSSTSIDTSRLSLFGDVVTTRLTSKLSSRYGSTKKQVTPCNSRPTTSTTRRTRATKMIATVQRFSRQGPSLLDLDRQFGAKEARAGSSQFAAMPVIGDVVVRKLILAHPRQRCRVYGAVVVTRFRHDLLAFSSAPLPPLRPYHYAPLNYPSGPTLALQQSSIMHSPLALIVLLAATLVAAAPAGRGESIYLFKLRCLELMPFLLQLSLLRPLPPSDSCRSCRTCSLHSKTPRDSWQPPPTRSFFPPSPVNSPAPFLPLFLPLFLLSSKLFSPLSLVS